MAAYSDVDICNIALAYIGADSIRSFDETNKRSRLCGIFFPSMRKMLLDGFDWPFARKLAALAAAPTTVTTPPGWYAYALPSDCSRVRDLYPPGSRDPWELIGRYLHCAMSENVHVYYTVKEIETARFSEAFSQLLALGVAVRLCMPITQNRDLYKSLAEEFRVMKMEVWEAEANTGNSYRAYNENPDNDTFVNNEVQDAFNYTDPWEL